MRIITKWTTVLLTLSLLVGCGGKSKTESNTGWTDKDKAAAGFSTSKKYKGHQTPPGMVLIEGGTFTMGSVVDDVMFDWNTTPNRQQVRSFYMDETEVTNGEYLFYLEFLQKVFPPDVEVYQHIYHAALPDTLVWRDRLGFNESLIDTYLRHPGYADYPVVGVSWIQANAYCKWRTDRVNEKILREKGVLKDLYNMEDRNVEGKNHFITDSYLLDPYYLFDGDPNIYKKGLPDNRKKKKDAEPKDPNNEFRGRHVKMTDGILMPKFRLPTETEWEFAAKALSENREYNNIRGRKKFPWNGRYTRNKSNKHRGDQLANFKLAKGDYSGISGWTNDGADITTAVKSYPPNAFGLYDMAGNVAEWVADVYRPIIDTEANDFNYFRGNVFKKPLIDENGKVVIADENNMRYDTLDNGKIVPMEQLGEIVYVPITKDDAYMKVNYDKSYNIDYRDGDMASTRQYLRQDEAETEAKMYNHPEIVSQVDEEGKRVMTYDSKVRHTLISDKARVYKGGSWQDREYWLDPAQRRFLPEYSATNYIGFRCAMDKLGPMKEERRKPYPKKRK